MQPLNFHNVQYTIPQQFFAEKVLEMLHRGTIDTYRARVMNPRTILEELCDLIKGRIKGRIPNKQGMLYAVEEAKQLIDSEESYLNFYPFSKDMILSTIGKLHSDQNNDQLKKILIVLKDFYYNHNKDYSKILIETIQIKIDEYDDTKSFDENFEVLDSISNLSTYFITELMYLGYTKRFLYRKFSNEFNSRGTRNFAHSFDNIKKTIDYESLSYKVVFKLEIPSSVVASITPAEYTVIKDDIGEYVPDNGRPSMMQEVMAFANKKLRNTHFYCVDVTARDVFQALNKARVNFAENLDLIHLGYSEQAITKAEKVLIINQIYNGSNFYTVQPVAYELDGQFKDGSDLYRNLFDAIKRIEENFDIKTDSKEKIKSAVRYLRLGNEALEVEHKFINYWFALEHLFSDALTDNQDATINKIKRAFPKLHCTIFIKRLIKDLHDNIIRLELQATIPMFSATDLNYLKDEATYDWIITNLFATNPLLAFRSIKVKRALFALETDPKKSPICKRIIQHRIDLEWHLARMYRIRNSIVHDASVGKNIISITANLKYYLIFVISHIIKILENNSSLQSVEDLLALSEEMYNSLEKEVFPIDKILQIETHFDLID